MKHHNIWYTNTNKLLKTIVLLGKTNNKVDYDYITALILSVSATIALPIWSLLNQRHQIVFSLLIQYHECLQHYFQVYYFCSYQLYYFITKRGREKCQNNRNSTTD